MPRTYNPLSGEIEFKGTNYVEETRAPTAADVWEDTTIWIDTSTSNVYMAIDTVAGATTWVTLTNSGGTMTDLDGDTGTATPVAGVITIAGGTGLTTAAAGSTVTVNLDSPVTVGNGGTGATTLTDGGIVLGSGTNAVTVTAQPTDGQLLIGDTGTDPVLATLTEGEAIDITNAAGSIAIACEVATDSNLGVAKFESADFTIAAGAISLDDDVLKGVAGDSGLAAGSSHSFTIAGGSGISTVAAGGTVTINAVGGGFDWVRVAGTTQAMAVSTGYTNTNGALTTFTLPATASLGDVMKINGEGAALFRISQNASQQMRMGPLTSTAGVGGYALSSKIYDCVTIRCVVQDTTFEIEASQGNIGLL